MLFGKREEKQRSMLISHVRKKKEKNRKNKEGK
jgi:hypothetical protein